MFPNFGGKKMERRFLIYWWAELGINEPLECFGLIMQIYGGGIGLPINSSPLEIYLKNGI